MSRRASVRRRGAPRAALCAAALALVCAAPAQAAPEWDYGLPEESVEESCFSIGNPDVFNLEPNISARAGMLVDPQDLPVVGEVFYGAVFIGQVRGCYEDFVMPEALPPAGVELAVSAADPIRCFSIPSGGTQTPISVDGGCPVTAGPGLHGGRSLSPGGDASMVWRLDPQEVLLIEFPLRSSRPLTGLPGGPTCPARAARTGPCPVDAAGDFLQTPVKVLDNGTSPTLTPALGLFAVPGTPGAPPAPGGPAPQPGPGTSPGTEPAGRLLSVPRRARARAGVRITVRVPAAGATVTARLRARGTSLADVRRRGVAAGELRLRLRPSARAARRALRGRRSVRATVRVAIAVPGRPVVRATARLTLRR